MNSHDPHEDIERELTAAFHAAADDVHPTGRPLADRTAIAVPRASRGRWLAPVAVAAAVVAIGVPAAVIAGRSGAPTTASAAGGSVVAAADGYVTAAGVRFPLPEGSTARAIDESAAAVTVCVAARPSGDCDGVTVRIAIPDAAGDITPLPDPLSYEGSPSDAAAAGGELSSSVPESASETPVTMTSSAGSSPVATTPVFGSPSGSAPSSSIDDGAQGDSTIANSSTEAIQISSTEGVQVDGSLPVATTYDPATSLCPILDNTDPLGGRPAQHVLMGACAPGSPQSLIWYVTDGSLTIWTPRGAAAAEATQIAAGIDFAGYRHQFGPQVAEVTMGTSAPKSSVFSVPLGTAGTTLEVTGSTGVTASSPTATR